MTWYCSSCPKFKKTDIEPESEKYLFERYVDDIVCTVSDKTDDLHKNISYLRWKMEFTTKRTEKMLIKNEGAIISLCPITALAQKFLNTVFSLYV